MPAEKSSWYTIVEASRQLHCSPKTIYNYQKNHKIKLFRKAIPYKHRHGNRKIWAINNENYQTFKTLYHQKKPNDYLSLPEIRTLYPQYTIKMLGVWMHKSNIPFRHYKLNQNTQVSNCYYKPDTINYLNHITNLRYQKLHAYDTKNPPRVTEKPINTHKYYQYGIDYDITKLSKALQINSQIVVQWINYKRVKYSCDPNHKLFFTPAQITAIYHNYHNYPNGIDKTLSNAQLAQKFKISSGQIMCIAKRHHISKVKVLGDNYIYYYKKDLPKLKKYLTDWLNTKNTASN